MSKQKFRNYLNYVLVYLLIATSGIPFFYNGESNITYPIIFAIILITIILIKDSLLLTINPVFITVYISVLLFVTFLQLIFVDILAYYTLLNFLKRVVLALIILYVVREKFFKLYINIILVAGVISLIIHTLSYIFPPFFNFLIKDVVPLIPVQSKNLYHYNYQIIIHNFWQRDLFRNSGPFWEPGANAGFTLIALFFNLFLFKQPLISKKNIVFLVIIATTISTTGILACIILLLFRLVTGKKALLINFFLLPGLFLGIQYFISNSEFLGAKIIYQIERIDSDKAGASRFASARMDYETFRKYPLSGYPILDVKKGLVSEEEDYRTNGVFILLARYGIIFFLCFFIFIYISFKKILNFFKVNNRNIISLLFVLFLLIIGFSENYFSRPLFIAFSLFLPFIPRRSCKTDANFDFSQ